ncbi:hypothetical protein L1887_40737 [Cichorium endivia]|nr:hypothetical protein L1887_40737 [Cichorium endivia]
MLVLRSPLLVLAFLFSKDLSLLALELPPKLLPPAVKVAVPIVNCDSGTHSVSDLEAGIASMVSSEVNVTSISSGDMGIEKSSTQAFANKRRIEAIMDGNGCWHHASNIPKIFVDHFSDFLGSNPTVCPILDPDSLDKKISDACATNMIKPVSHEEIKAALFDINDNRAPGPDGEWIRICPGLDSGTAYDCKDIVADKICWLSSTGKLVDFSMGRLDGCVNPQCDFCCEDPGKRLILILQCSWRNGFGIRSTRSRRGGSRLNALWKFLDNVNLPNLAKFGGRDVFFYFARVPGGPLSLVIRGPLRWKIRDTL